MATKIGISVTKSIPSYAGSTVDIGFWSPTGIDADSEIFRLTLRMRGYASKAYFLANGKRSFYEPATIYLTFQLTAGTWPFTPGQDPWPSLWTLISSLSAVQDADGNEINGGLDWSSGVVESVG